MSPPAALLQGTQSTLYTPPPTGRPVVTVMFNLDLASLPELRMFARAGPGS